MKCPHCQCDGIHKDTIYPGEPFTVYRCPFCGKYCVAFKDRQALKKYGVIEKES